MSFSQTNGTGKVEGSTNVAVHRTLHLSEYGSSRINIPRATAIVLGSGTLFRILTIFCELAVLGKFGGNGAACIYEIRLCLMYAHTANSLSKNGDL